MAVFPYRPSRAWLFATPEDVQDFVNRARTDEDSSLLVPIRQAVDEYWMQSPLTLHTT